RGALRFAPVLPNAPVHLGFDLTRPSLGLRLFFKGFDLQWLPFLRTRTCQPMMRLSRSFLAVTLARIRSL
ncbi:hypothetical protein GGI1_10273, partial [Acidithiobacillus sp. GGI-221]